MKTVDLNYKGITGYHNLGGVKKIIPYNRGKEQTMSSLYDMTASAGNAFGGYNPNKRCILAEVMKAQR